METPGQKPGTWVKGQSGNPAGRPKGSLSVAESLQRALERKWIVPDGEEKGEKRTKLDQLCRSMVDLAIQGNVQAASWVGDRLEGRVASKVELTNTSQHQVVVVPWLPATREAIQAAELQGRLTSGGEPMGHHQVEPAKGAKTPPPGLVEVLNLNENLDLVEGAVEVEGEAAGNLPDDPHQE